MTPDERSNGLTADTWTALALVDPRLVPGLLDALAEAQIAARTEPARGTRGPYLDVKLPSLPQEQVYVDATRLSAAREVLDHITGAHTDRAFEAIVAGWEGPLPDVEWPGEAPIRPQGGEATSVVWRAPETAFDPDAIDFALDSVGDEPEGHYEAPAPPRITWPSWPALLSAVALLTGLFLLIWSGSTDQNDPFWMLAGSLGVIGGLFGLVMRLRDDRTDPGDPFDDGARV